MVNENQQKAWSCTYDESERKNEKGRGRKAACHLISFLVLLELTVMSAKVFGKDIGIGSTMPEITNIGFVKNPPKKLKDKFPMCDAFLRVDWIDKKKRIGYSRYDLYKSGKKNGQTIALVYLNQYYPHFNYDLYKYRHGGKLQKVFSFIKKGKIVGEEAQLSIQNGKKIITFWVIAGTDDPTLFDHRQNVCIPYPDNKRMWIAESKQVGKAFTDQQIKEKYEKVELSFPGLSLIGFKQMNVIDLNYDRAEDYFQNIGWFLYSNANRYFEIRKIGVVYAPLAGKGYLPGYLPSSKWYFPHSKRTCELSPMGLLYLTTDGKNYYFSNQCNLTELTKEGN